MLLSGGCAFVARRLFKGKAAKRPAEILVPGGSIIRAMDPWGAFCWSGVRGAGGLATRGACDADGTGGEVVGGNAAGGGAPVTEGPTGFSSDGRDKGSVLYCGLETGVGGAGGAELDTMRFSVTSGGRPPNSLGMFINARSILLLLLAAVLLLDDMGSPSMLCWPSF